MSTLTISLIEDSPLDVEFLRFILLKNPDFHLVDSWSNIEDFLKTPSKKRISNHIILLDIMLDKTNSLEYIDAIRTKFPSSEIIIYSQLDNYNNLIKALRNGAAGYIIKSKDPKKIIQQLEVIKKGGAIISPEMARKLIINIRDYFTSFTASNKLSILEIETLELLAQGWTYNIIAEKLNLSIDGVRSRIRRIYAKLGVKNKISAIQKFQSYFN